VPVIAMKAFDVTITKTLQAVVTVEAESAEEAMRMVNDQWRAGDHILDAENFVDVDFEADAGRELEATQEQNRKTMEVLLVEPGQCPRIVPIGTDLKALQQTVGGNIEAVYPYDDPVALVCADEGKINGFPLNRAIRDDDGDVADIIAGTFFICGLGDEDFASLPKDLQEKYEEKFHSPETFLKLGNRIRVIPVEPLKETSAKDKTSHGMEL
jgi:hypothetical protein